MTIHSSYPTPETGFITKTKKKMKKECKYFFSAVIGMLMLSCNDGDDMSNPVKPVEPDAAASITLKLSNEAVVKTRAMDDLQNDNTQNILKLKGDVNIFFFAGNGSLVMSDRPAATDLVSGKQYTYEDGITTSISEVIVVGNIPDITSGINSKAGLQAILSTLEAAQSAYMKAEPDIWVYGASTSIDWDSNPLINGMKHGKCTIDMAPILSRIDVTVKTDGITNGYTPSSPSTSNVYFKGVAVLYSGAYSHYIPGFVPLMATLSTGVGPGTLPLRSGLDDNNFPLWTASDQVSVLTGDNGGSESLLHATWNGLWNTQSNEGTPGKFERTFYAFPSSIESGYYNRNTILTVYADYKETPGAAGDPTPLFWSVRFADNQQIKGGSFAQPLENGNIYQLTLNMTGDYSDGGGGTTDPEAEFANLDVTINQIKWKTVIPMEVDFNN